MRGLSWNNNNLLIAKVKVLSGREGNNNFLGARNSSSSCDLFVKETYICWPFSSCCTSFSSDTFNYFGFSVYLFAPYFSPSSPCFKTPIINGLFSVSFLKINFMNFLRACDVWLFWLAKFDQFLSNSDSFTFDMYYWQNKPKSLILPFWWNTYPISRDDSHYIWKCLS